MFLHAKTDTLPWLFPQMAGHPADFAGHPADFAGHPADLSCHAAVFSGSHFAKLVSGGHVADLTVGEPADLSRSHGVQPSEHPADLSKGHLNDLTTGHSANLTGHAASLTASVQSADLPGGQSTSTDLAGHSGVISSSHPAILAGHVVTPLSGHPADLSGHPVDLLAGGYPADLLTSICKQMLPRFPVQPPVSSFAETSPISATTPVKCDDSSHPYKCEVCGKRYMKRDGLVRHWKYHDTNLHPCRRCTLFFQSEDQLQSHIDSKHGPDNLKHSCPVCGKKFDRPQLLKKHVETRHYQSYTIPESSADGTNRSHLGE